jgi:putative ATP-dependent endonuclease of the OLD family
MLLFHKSLCQLSDATVNIDNKKLLKLTYKFSPQKDISGKVSYSYIIYKGNDESKIFTHEDRKYLNIKVIKAIRDVESEMRNTKSSPLTRLIKQKYKINQEDIKAISDELKKTGANTLELPELSDLQTKIKSLFNDIISYSNDEFDISLKTMDIDATRILYALKPLINARDSSNTSLGINNILYVLLMMLLISDDTIKTYIPSALYDELFPKDTAGLLPKYYKKIEKGYVLRTDSKSFKKQKLYDFLYEHNPDNIGVTILAIEEPEAHLHPIYQRLLYKYVVNNANAPVIITTHSTHISSVSPITSIVHLVKSDTGTKVSTTAKLPLNEKEQSDISRYIDVKRGEIYLAKGIIFVEGISEEYLIPSFAECLDYELDRYGVIVCNINSTNFKPYKQFADILNIPNVIVTDGDYYHKNDKDEVVYGDMHEESHKGFGYAGNERGLELCKLFLDEKLVGKIQNKKFHEQGAFCAENGIFIGLHTFEIDIFDILDDKDKEIIVVLFEELTAGGSTQVANFKKNLNCKNYTKCLSAIESSHSQIGKGRFAQRLASSCTIDMTPEYVKNAIISICKKVGGGAND